jgi:hypothetical protein
MKTREQTDSKGRKMTIIGPHEIGVPKTPVVSQRKEFLGALAGWY